MKSLNEKTIHHFSDVRMTAKKLMKAALSCEWDSSLQCIIFHPLPKHMWRDIPFGDGIIKLNALKYRKWKFLSPLSSEMWKSSSPVLFTPKVLWTYSELKHCQIIILSSNSFIAWIQFRVWCTLRSTNFCTFA